MENKITIINQDGKEFNYEILFTFIDEDTGKNYALLDEGDDAILVEYDESSGVIKLVEDDKILAKAEEIMEEYYETQEE